MLIKYVLNGDNTINHWRQTNTAGENVIEVDFEPSSQVTIFENVDKVIGGQFVQGDRYAYLEQQKVKEQENDNEFRRALYLDAYRKYQAAVNYGEFERAEAIDAFIGKLRNKDWTAFDNIPSQIKYFTGEVGFSDSGLKTP